MLNMLWDINVVLLSERLNAEGCGHILLQVVGHGGQSLWQVDLIGPSSGADPMSMLFSDAARSKPIQNGSQQLVLAFKDLSFRKCARLVVGDVGDVFAVAAARRGGVCVLLCRLGVRSPAHHFCRVGIACGALN